MKVCCKCSTHIFCERWKTIFCAAVAEVRWSSGQILLPHETAEVRPAAARRLLSGSTKVAPSRGTREQSASSGWSEVAPSRAPVLEPDGAPQHRRPVPDHWPAGTAWRTGQAVQAGSSTAAARRVLVWTTRQRLIEIKSRVRLHRSAEDQPGTQRPAQLHAQILPAMHVLTHSPFDNGAHNKKTMEYLSQIQSSGYKLFLFVTSVLLCYIVICSLFSRVAWV